eukprot:scaffold102133_cov61-Attheya_sp.AAC.6
MKNPDVVWVIGMSEKMIETQLKSSDIEKEVIRSSRPRFPAQMRQWREHELYNTFLVLKSSYDERCCSR